MRLRKNWAARPQMEASRFCIYNPYELKGKWNEVFQNDNEIHLELGCGRGAFIAEMAQRNPDINYIAVDLKDEVLIYVLRKIEKLNLENVRILPINIMLMDGVFDKNDIGRIFLNFSTPWPKPRHNKRRLTYGRFLDMYKKFLKPEAEIWFKTDNKPFFMDSCNYFKQNGFKLKYLTFDLHSSIYNSESPMTEYEEKFTKLGMKTMFLIAKLKR
ncbi:tRNA (guanine-N(7)-)-methyltransferase [Clostridium tepidiprofundi DSM 19306]|uniref:tRNA (guanine-N(7)-)-methyltransferase n=1 Tax=Clostridium tepidiprofundi DSM 19306 TaxID=1121338 RepID=A0A151B649_9CLOT|nr:tRNA (guanosine(46)-N7)-methyltransferase TrmB [Clostridium tepidiprofundi]KYH35374.1 tRNA (guanine-N(7)-)-methyltransferase [Clostridium tepidiprofundi DSM 19306]